MELPSSRLDSLYKDFRPLKELNPDGYVANIGTWKEYLKRRYFQENCLFICGHELLQELNRDIYGIPKSIDVVIDSLVEEGYLVSSEDFYEQRMYCEQYPRIMQWMGFGKNKVLKSRKSENDLYLKNLQLIVRPNVEKKCKKIAEEIRDNIIDTASSVIDLILPLKEFYQRCNFFDYVKKEDNDLALFYLVNYKKTVIMGDNFIKVIAPSLDSNSLTDNDVRIADLKNVLTNIGNQVNKMEIERSDYSKILCRSVKERAPREVQRKYLQAMKLVEKYLYRLLDHQSNLLEIKGQIEMAITNEILVNTLSEANQAMKSIKQYSSSVEKVEQLLDELKEHREQADEIGTMLAGTDEAIDEDELNAELARIDSQLGKELEPSEANQEAKVLEKLTDLKIGEQKSDQNSSNSEKTRSNKQLVSEYY